MESNQGAHHLYGKDRIGCMSTRLFTTIENKERCVLPIHSFILPQSVVEIQLLRESNNILKRKKLHLVGKASTQAMNILDGDGA